MVVRPIHIILDTSDKHWEIHYTTDELDEIEEGKVPTIYVLPGSGFKLLN